MKLRILAVATVVVVAGMAYLFYHSQVITPAHTQEVVSVIDQGVIK